MKFTKEYRARLGKKVWGFRCRIGKQRVQIFIWDEREDAERAYEELIRQNAEERRGIAQPGDPVTLAQLVAERISELDTDNNKNHRTTKRVLESFRDHFPRAQLVTALTDEDVRGFKRARLAQFKRKHRRPMANNSINRELEQLAAMFNSAGSYFHSLKSWKHPLIPYEHVPPEGRERVITHTEDEKLLAELRAPRRPGSPRTEGRGPRAAEQFLAWLTRQTVADLWELALNVGMRRNEMRKLEKDWIDWREQLIQLPKHVIKTRKAREVPLNSVALDILRRRCALSGHPRFVFTNARGSNILGEYQMYRAIRSAARRAGLNYGQRVEGGFTIHDTRHTAITRMLHRGNDLATIADVVGHSKKTMTLKYGHSTLESKRRAVASLAANNGGSSDEEATKKKSADTKALSATDRKR